MPGRAMDQSLTLINAQVQFLVSHYLLFLQISIGLLLSLDLHKNAYT